MKIDTKKICYVLLRSLGVPKEQALKDIIEHSVEADEQFVEPVKKVEKTPPKGIEMAVKMIPELLLGIFGESEEQIIETTATGIIEKVIEDGRYTMPFNQWTFTRALPQLARMAAWRDVLNYSNVDGNKKPPHSYRIDVSRLKVLVDPSNIDSMTDKEVSEELERQGIDADKGYEKVTKMIDEAKDERNVVMLAETWLKDSHKSGKEKEPIANALSNITKADEMLKEIDELKEKSIYLRSIHAIKEKRANSIQTLKQFFK